MNGRCTTDPLDTADDICDFCGKAFCSSCLIDLGKRGHGPVCRSCAVANSGIRGSRPSTPRPSRATLKAARAELALLNENRPAPIFEFFDTTLEPEVLATLHSSQSETGSEPSPINESDSTTPTTQALGLAVPALSAALEKFKPKRRGRRATDEPLIDDAEDGDENPLQNLTHLFDDLGPAESASSEATPVEATDHQPHSPHSGMVPAPSADHGPAPQPTARAASADPEVTPEGSELGPLNVHHDPFELADRPFDPSIDPFAPVGAASHPQPASAESAARSPSNADRDAAGNWVPPMLRGMDPEAESAGIHLPKRRRATD